LTPALLGNVVKTAAPAICTLPLRAAEAFRCFTAARQDGVLPEGVVVLVVQMVVVAEYASIKNARLLVLSALK
jgi:hypothetical protein